MIQIILNIIGPIILALLFFKVGYKRGWDAGVDDTFKYLHENPFPHEFLEKRNE